MWNTGISNILKTTTYTALPVMIFSTRNVPLSASFLGPVDQFDEIVETSEWPRHYRARKEELDLVVVLGVLPLDHTLLPDTVVRHVHWK